VNKAFSFFLHVPAFQALKKSLIQSYQVFERVPQGMTLFGAGAVRGHKKISLVINLELWDQKKNYDRLGFQ